MIASAFSLGDFLRPVPLCLYSTTWDELIVLLCEQPSSEVVMVGEQSQALGVISGSALLAYLVKRSLQIRSSTRTIVGTGEFLEKDIGLLLEPIVSFQEDTPISGFLSQLTPDSHRHYGIVNREGQFLGLIDHSKLLQTLKFGQKKPLTSQLSPLLQKILDQFPLPLMIQSESNFILYQNPIWQEEVGGQTLQARVVTGEDRNSAVGEGLSHENYPLVAAQLSCAQWLEYRSNQPTDLLDHDFPRGKESTTSQRTEKIWQFVKCPFQVLVGSQNGWLTVAIDQTLSHQMSQKLTAKNQDLIQLNRLKDEFFASISHEIKSPVTTIVGLSSLLRDHPGGGLNPRQQEYVDLIFQNGRQLMNLVNDLLDLTGLETGQMGLNYASISVRDICEQVLQMIGDKYCDRFLNPSGMSLEIAPGVQSFRADELRLKQILIYLLENAVQSTLQEGQFGLKVRPSGQWLTFTVWDTGIGIAEPSQPFVFERIHPTARTWVPTGEGLGLVLAQKLAQAHGGDISFWSKEGEGSQFTLIIPAESPNNARPSGSQQPTLGGEDWVLVVDAIAKTLEELPPPLTDLGYSVMIARTGLEAVEKARRLQPKYIFLNPTLPLLSGWDVLTLLKSAEETRHITVILTEDPIERPINQGFSEDWLLPPPYTVESLHRLLQQPVEKMDLPALVTRSLTILHLFPEAKPLQPLAPVPKFPFDLTVISQLSPFNHRILEADDLDQAEMITQVWEVDVVVLDGRGLNPARDYLIQLSQCPRLATLPLVILDLPTAEIANQIPGLTVFPCLILDENPPLDQFWQILQVATRLQ